MSRVELRQSILRILLGAGYDRARFYERCADVGSTDRYILVLVAEEVNEGDVDASHIAKCIPADEASIGYDENSKETVFRRKPEDFDPRPDWIDELELDDRVWADVNLRVLGKSVGAIAVDWQGSEEDLTDTDARLLAGIGTMVAQHLQLRPPDRVHSFRAAIGRQAGQGKQQDVEPEPPVAKLMDDALLAIAEILDARMAALFEYRWSTGQISKKREYDTRLGRKRWKPDEVLVLPETYHIEENLTGQAWVNPSYRHVPHFSRASNPLLKLINKESEDRHAEYMGEDPFTCLYGRIESMEPRYMIRLMNRGASDPTPYVGERLLLQEILEELRGIVDKATALGRTASLEHATRLAAENTDPATMLDELGSLLQMEDVNDAIVLCHRHQSDQFSFCGVHGDQVHEVTQGAFAEWRKDSLYRFLMSRRELEYIDRYAIRRNAAGSPIARQLQEQVTGMVVIRLAAGDTEGVLLIPLKPGLGVKQRNLYEYCGIGRLSLLKAYGSLLVDVVDSSVARARADGARRALGVLGHELATPLARMGGLAESSLSEIRRTAIEVERHLEANRVKEANEAIDRVRSAAMGYRGQIQGERRSIGTAMSLAPLVAQESDDGRLELQMVKCDLGTLTLRAMSQARQESRDQARRLYADSKGRAPTYSFTHTSTVLELGEIVGDPGLLYLAILNVLRNAFKYSIPSPRSNVCEINVSAQPQKGMKIVLVKNIGRELDPESIDRIFEPWVRLADDRDSTARTGMGIGLFFSRRLAAAHHGTVLCSSSVPYREREAPARTDSSEEARLDRLLEGARISQRRDATRGLQLEGDNQSMQPRFATTFEIRIKDSLKPGAYVHEWSPGYARARTRRRPFG